MVRLLSFVLAVVAAWLLVWLMGLVLPLNRTAEYAAFGAAGVGLYQGFKALFRQKSNVR
jgi:hypothetical protein